MTMSSSSTQNIKWQETMRTLSESAKYLFDNQEMSDVTFIFKCSDSKHKKIYAHSWILSMMSPIFYNSFKNNFEVKMEILIADISKDVFLELLRFVYTGECILSQLNVFDILLVAKTYSLKFLEENCVQFVASSPNFFTVDSACQILKKAQKSTYNALQDKVLKYIGPRMPSILNTEEFLSTDKECLRAILTIQETGRLTEMEVFSAVMKWAARKCIINGMESNGKNKRHHLGDIVKLIRFPTMTTKEIGQCIVEEDGLLNSEETLSLFLCITNKQPNALGFVSERRKQFGFLEDIVSTRIRLYDENPKRFTSKFKQTTDVRSIFTVDRNIFLTEISVGVSDDQLDVSVQLWDNNKNLLDDSFEVVKDIFGNEWLTLVQPIILENDRNYVLNIDYGNTNSEIYKIEKKKFPWAKTQKNVQFKFVKLSQFLFGFGFKPSP